MELGGMDNLTYLFISVVRIVTIYIREIYMMVSERVFLQLFSERWISFLGVHAKGFQVSFMAEKYLVSRSHVCYLRRWVFAQLEHETRTTDSSLKYLAAASDSGL